MLSLEIHSVYSLYLEKCIAKKHYLFILGKILKNSSLSGSRQKKQGNPERQLFSSAADARKRPAKCAVAHKQTDDKADAVLRNSCVLLRSTLRG